MRIWEYSQIGEMFCIILKITQSIKFQLSNAYINQTYYCKQFKLNTNSSTTVTVTG